MSQGDYEDELLAFDEEVSGEDYETELAAELLNVADEQELDEFFGALFRKGRAFLQSPAGQRLKAMLRSTARAALPLPAATAAEPEPPVAEPEPDAGSGELFGIETEGLSPEDRDLEIARRVVRLAGDAVRRLADAPPGNAAQAARRAFIDAARRHAPGIASRLRAGVTLNAERQMKEKQTMHDLDRTLRSQESENETYDLEAQIFGEAEADYEYASDELSEEEEIDLAAELLGVSDEQELDEFFRRLFNKAKSVAGTALKKYLKPLARKALPIAAGAVGGFFGGPAGAAIGGKLGSFASTLFETDFESMDGEVQDMEVARRFVRFADAAAKNAAASGGGDPDSVARAAIVSAAKAHAPGLLRSGNARPGGYGANGVSRVRRANSGRWIRREGRIVLLGV
jgi:hypothetical protein